MPSVSMPPFEPAPHMREALKKYIANQRIKKKEEADQTAALHEERKARLERKEQDSISLEKTNEQLCEAKRRLVDLQQEKHDLFNQLKKVVSLEEEQKRRKELFQAQREREAKEILSKVGPAPNLNLSGIVGPSISAVSTNATTSRFNPSIPSHVPPLKRWRPPSPPRPIATSSTSAAYYNQPKQITSTPPYKQQYKPHMGGYPPQKLFTPTPYGTAPTTLPPPPPPPRAVPVRPLTIPSIPIMPQQHKQVGGLTSGFPLHKSPTTPQTLNRTPFRF